VGYPLRRENPTIGTKAPIFNQGASAGIQLQISMYFLRTNPRTRISKGISKDYQ